MNKVVICWSNYIFLQKYVFMISDKYLSDNVKGIIITKCYEYWDYWTYK